MFHQIQHINVSDEIWFNTGMVHKTRAVTFWPIESKIIHPHW